MADTSPAVTPALDALLREARHCFCQPAKTPFVAIPAIGTYLVQNGLAATYPDPAPDVPTADLIGEVIRGMYDYAALTLADAPPGVRLEIKLTADGMAETRVLGTYLFEPFPQEADRG